MKRPGRILVVDDDERWRSLLQEILQDGGFVVDTAATIAAAFEQLARSLYHLLVLDIRLDDADALNVEGMNMLDYLEERNIAGSVKLIMLSAHGTKAQMRTAFRDHDVADFQAKDDFDDIVFLEQVRALFARQPLADRELFERQLPVHRQAFVNINLGLAIHWQQVNGPEQVVLHMDFGGVQLKKQMPGQIALAAAELDDLLCRLFFRADTVLVQPLAAGHSGGGILLAQPFLETGGARAVIVKYGDVGKLEAERRHFEEYVLPFIGGGRNTSILTIRRTLRLSGIVYSLLGAPTERLNDFGSLYDRVDAEQINVLLDHLFFDTCGTWYANLGRLQAHDLTAEYQELCGFTIEKLQQALTEQLKNVQGKNQLQFRSLHDDRLFTNPIPLIADKRLVRPTYICTTHGEFNEHNILIDAEGHTWLIDFLRTGPGHVLRDVVLLDAIVRIQLLGPHDASIDERLRMEELLCSIDRFSQLDQLAGKLPFENPALAKACAVSLHLRGIARRLVRQNPADDFSEYHIASLYQTINMIRFYWLSAVQREHALLCASLLAERLRL